MVMFSFSVLERTFWKFDPENQNCLFELKLRFQMSEFDGDIQLFCFRPKIFFLGKFDPKNKK